MDLVSVEEDGKSMEVEKHEVIDQEPVLDCDQMKEPCVGMIFNSFEEAKYFYEEYGRQNGYNIRTRSTYKDRRGPEVTSALFVCSCEGFNHKLPKQEDEVGNNKRTSATIRSGCKACMRITNVKGTTIWRITVFSDEHNHLLFGQRKNDVSKCNIATPDQATTKLNEGMRISQICRRLTQLAYMAGKSEEIYKVVMADMDETFKKVSRMNKEALKYETGVESANETSGCLENPGNSPEVVEENNQLTAVDPCIVQAKGRKRKAKGKGKVENTGVRNSETQLEVSAGIASDQSSPGGTLLQ